MLWVNPGRHWAPHSCLLTIHLGWGRESEGQKWENSWFEIRIVYNLMSKAKQNKEFVTYFPLAGRCSAISRTAGLHHAQSLLWKTNAINYSCHPFSPPFVQFLLLSMMSYGMGYPPGQLESAVPAVSPPNLLSTACLLHWRTVWETEKALTL